MNDFQRLIGGATDVVNILTTKLALTTTDTHGNALNADIRTVFLVIMSMNPTMNGTKMTINLRLSLTQG